MWRSITTEELQKAVNKSTSYAQIFKNLSYKMSGSAYKGIKERIKAENIETSHFLGKATYSRIAGIKNTRPFSEILVENSSYSCTSNLKKRLLRAGTLLPYCSECQQGPVWNGKPLVLQLDHINGTRSDNRIENLRILCPNCHTQTETYAGKGKSTPRCPDCLVFIHKGSLRCRACTNRIRASSDPSPFIKGKGECRWPTAEEILKSVWERPTSIIAKELGVSDSALGKRCRELGIKKPPRGWWAKKHT